MPRQLTFDLPVRPALGRGDFFVSPANALAVAQVDAGDWPEGKLLLIGPEGAGKSHLAQVWAGENDAAVLSAGAVPEEAVEALAVVVEDADRIAGDRAAETALFHLHNHVLARGGRLLVTAASPPRNWALSLIQWLVRRMDRSFATARALVADLDARALAHGGPVTREMARDALDLCSQPGS
jgi:chromosomal replication initiation ATPase DnaA